MSPGLLLALAASVAGCLGPFRAPLDGAADDVTTDMTSPDATDARVEDRVADGGSMPDSSDDAAVMDALDARADGDSASDARADAAADVISCDGSVCGVSCVNLQSDPLHCGGCGNACPTTANSTPTCEMGVCSIRCTPRFGDCNRNTSDGCEVNLDSDTSNCGRCGQGCSVSNGVAQCSAGTCGVRTCSMGWADCDRTYDNGCEVSTTSATNCGACGTTCSGATPVCGTSGTCVSGCTAGQVLCSMSCTNTSTDPLHCGGCGAACNLPHATEGCASSACTVASCDVGFGNCDGLPANGCEVDTTSSASHCGGCGRVCTPANVDTRLCSASACDYDRCSAGFADCDGMRANGCEANTTNSVTNCGACNMRCSYPNATATCASSMCVFGACNPGFVNLDRSTTNGCEYACVVLAGVDPVDGSGVDENCDGVDGILTDTVFVNGTSGSDTSDGLDPSRPMRTLRAAITAAGTSGRHAILLTANPIVDRAMPAAPITVSNGVSIHGGFDATFRARAMTRTAIFADWIALSARDITLPTTLSNLNVIANNVPLGTAEPSIALRVTNTGRWGSSMPLVVRNSRFQAGAGTVGVGGSTGSTGASGSAGSDGSPGSAASTPAGGAGGSASGCATGGAGGAGAIRNTTAPTTGSTGQQGAGTMFAGGTGGPGGMAAGSCTSSGNNGTAGNAGVTGSSIGTAGTGGRQTLTMSGLNPMGEPGGDGGIGLHGSAGGGGGGGSGVCTFSGASGGGGGAGGCGGSGGRGGTAGTGSFAVVLLNSAVDLSGSNEFEVLTGGTGGAGGLGGAGGTGGTGGAGGPRAGAPQSGAGGAGGTGGRGTNGGRGGGGAGGASICIVTNGQTYGGTMTFSCTLPTTGAAGGNGGNPGASGALATIQNIP